jgi:hypothetical protein
MKIFKSSLSKSSPDFDRSLTSLLSVRVLLAPGMPRSPLAPTGRIGLLPHFLPPFWKGRGLPLSDRPGGDLSPASRGENGGKWSPLVIVIGRDSFPPYGQRGRILPLLGKRKRRSSPWIMQRGESSLQLYHRADSHFNRKSSRGASRAGQTGAPRGITLGGGLL